MADPSLLLSGVEVKLAQNSPNTSDVNNSESFEIYCI